MRVGSSRRIVGLAAVCTSIVPLALTACDGDDPTVMVEVPDSLQDVVDATLAGPGLEVEYRVLSRGGDPVALLRAVTTYVAGSGDAHQVGYSGLPETGSPLDGSQPEEFLGETWVVDGTTHTLDPGAAAARPTTGNVASVLLGDDFGTPTATASEALSRLLSGWPGETVSDAEAIEGVPVAHVRLPDGDEDDDDVIDVWIDDGAQLVRVERRAERSPALYVELDFRVLRDEPSIPPLPPIEG